VLANILLLQLHLSYNEAVPVDGNVFGFCLAILMLRLILFRLPPKGIRFGFRSHAKDNPAIFNQAIMEFGFAMCS
jgi:hypothetical protein